MNQADNERALASREEAPTPLPETGSSILSRFPAIGTPEQVADVLQLSLTTVRQMLREGRIPAFKVSRQWRIPKFWLIQLINNGGIK